MKMVKEHIHSLCFCKNTNKMTETFNDVDIASTKTQEIEISGLEMLQNRDLEKTMNILSSTKVNDGGGNDDESHCHDSILLQRRRNELEEALSMDSFADSYAKDSLAFVRKRNLDESKDLLSVEYDGSFAESWLQSSQTSDMKHLSLSRNVSSDLSNMRPKKITNQAA